MKIIFFGRVTSTNTIYDHQVALAPCTAILKTLTNNDENCMVILRVIIEGTFVFKPMPVYKIENVLLSRFIDEFFFFFSFTYYGTVV